MGTQSQARRRFPPLDAGATAAMDRTSPQGAMDRASPAISPEKHSIAEECPHWSSEVIQRLQQAKDESPALHSPASSTGSGGFASRPGSGKPNAVARPASASRLRSPAGALKALEVTMSA